jgi:hypothetical protein
VTGEPAPQLSAIHSRIQNHAGKLYEALDDLEEAGGVKALRGLMKPSSVEKTVALLRAVRAAVDGTIAGVKQR